MRSSETELLFGRAGPQDDGINGDSQLWIHALRGSRIRPVIDMDVRGKEGKAHRELRIDYADGCLLVV